MHEHQGKRSKFIVMDIWLPRWSNLYAVSLTIVYPSLLFQVINLIILVAEAVHGNTFFLGNMFVFCHYIGYIFCWWELNNLCQSEIKMFAQVTHGNVSLPFMAYSPTISTPFLGNWIWTCWLQVSSPIHCYFTFLHCVNSGSKNSHSKTMGSFCWLT